MSDPTQCSSWPRTALALALICALGVTVGVTSRDWAAAAEPSVQDDTARPMCASDPSMEAACQKRKKYRHGRMGRTRDSWYNERGISKLKRLAKRDYRRDHRDMAARGAANWWRGFTRDSECAVIVAAKGICTNDTNVPQEPRWLKKATGVSAICGGTVVAAVYKTKPGNPASLLAVGGSAGGWCLFTTMVGFWMGD